MKTRDRLKRAKEVSGCPQCKGNLSQKSSVVNAIRVMAPCLSVQKAEESKEVPPLAVCSRKCELHSELSSVSLPGGSCSVVVVRGERGLHFIRIWELRRGSYHLLFFRAHTSKCPSAEAEFFPRYDFCLHPKPAVGETSFPFLL